MTADGFTFNPDHLIAGSDPQGPDGGICSACHVWCPESELQRDPVYDEGWLCPDCYEDTLEQLYEEELAAREEMERRDA